MIMNRLFEMQFAYTLQDLYGGSVYEVLNQSTFIDFVAEYGFYVPATQEGPEVDPYACSFKTDTNVYKIINQVFLRYKTHYVFVLPTDVVDSVEFNDAERHFREKLLIVLNLTYPKYNKLLELYESKKETLLAQITSGDTETSSSSQNEQHASIESGENESRMNDTPQADNFSDPFAGDDYVSEFSKGTSTTTDNGNSSVSGTGSRTNTHTEDGGTPIQRLAEIERNYSMIMKKWLNEFESLFIEEGNI